MMESLRSWLLGIVLAAFASGLARQLVPSGKEQAFVRFASGLLMILALLRPLTEIPWHKSDLAVGSFYRTARQQTNEYTEDGQKALRAIIEEKTASYIWDKATELGLDCTVSVDAAVAEGGILLPDRVTITAPYSQSLAEWLEGVVGIPAEKQFWLEEST